ncbi:hypothetical protein FD16_GL001173 [Paucilactobacillus suebicus DSM 5007 = KCTC 3549]|uniref:Uncharacterized protein n=1 Tax=Paucilactobacillus suebicus DSM 5007 = KCTC 3549 TaxID=1423807 RepID=A0A0R1W385_9LACO|nr:hypothetical protein FD16_GL001173 [Paucilactobacillus suebicus DSM 5007 = KCTC 3549]
MYILEETVMQLPQKKAWHHSSEFTGLTIKQLTVKQSLVRGLVAFIIGSLIIAFKKE